MLWVKKIKEGVQNVLKLHLASIITFLIFCIVVGIMFEMNGFFEILHFLAVFLSLFTAALVLCEANFAYKKKNRQDKQYQGSQKVFCLCHRACDWDCCFRYPGILNHLRRLTAVVC